MPLTTNMDTLGVKQHTHEYEITLEPGSVTTTEALTGVPGAIQPDDTANLGSSNALARSDHRHAITAAAAAALTRTATASEGVAASFARSDHVHATDQMGWGIVGTPFTSTSDQPHTATGTSDMSVASISHLATRNYEIILDMRVDISAAGDWDINIAAAGSTLKRAFHVVTIGSAAELRVRATLLWQPGTGTSTVDVRLIETAGTATLTLKGVSPDGPRQLYVKDIGPR